jgi:tRNA-2-methylthio-N6-dimethylallyladenosine synthase
MAHVRTYGCQQNVSDSEKIKGLLSEMGYDFTESLAEADVVIFNTCAVREHAEQRVFGNVGALKSYKLRRPMIIGLCGCMMQQPHIAEKIRTSFPHVDIVFGTHALHKLPQLLYNYLTDKKRIFEIDEQTSCIEEGITLKRDSKFKAYLPVMYGCNNFCSYCIVPYVRGRERSRSPEIILEEATQLVADGYKEIMLLGQNVNSYANDLDNGYNFAMLLRALNDIDGDFRIRFMTSHPKDATPELFTAMAECEKVCKHLHLPYQSGSDKVLKMMNRGYTKEQYLELIKTAKAIIPNLSVSSDVIIGFPGETYRDILFTLDVAKQVQFINLFTFIYSKRKGTPAEKLEDTASREDKLKWFDELLKKQEAITKKLLTAYVGKTYRVLADGIGKTGENYLTGRTDSNVIVDFVADNSLIGSFVDVKITKALNFMIIGELIN